jgi:outer membrane protein assembly factor BamA
VIARWRLCLAALPLLVSPAAAQAPDPQDGVPVVQYLQIIREDIADTNETGFIAGTANALHVRTREKVVEREVLLKPGMPYDSALAAETARNLRALGIFRYVLVDTVRSDSGLTLRVVTKDGWSTFPIFDITTAAGQSAVAIGAAEANLLGLAATGLVRYSSNPDRTAWLFAFRQPRMFGGHVNVGLSLEERSDGRFVAGQM